MLISDLPSSVPVLLLAVADNQAEELPEELKAVFSQEFSNVYRLHPPSIDAIREFLFHFVVDVKNSKPSQIKTHQQKQEEVLQPLQIAPTKPIKPSYSMIQQQKQHDEHVRRNLRMALRSIYSRLAKNFKVCFIFLYLFFYLFLYLFK